MTDSRRAAGRFGVRAATLAAAILAGTVAVARAETPPYPPSRVVAGITWHTDTYRFGDVGGDIWSVTSDADGTVYTAWGDAAVGGCTAKASYGVGAIVGGLGTDVAATGCGPAGLNHGKLGSLLDVGGNALRRRQHPVAAVALPGLPGLALGGPRRHLAEADLVLPRHGADHPPELLRQCRPRRCRQ